MLSLRRGFKTIKIGVAAAVAGGVCIAAYQAYNAEPPNTLNSLDLPSPPKRNEQLEKLAAGDVFDILVIGGGATGCGVALDAATRGLKVALVERDDFSSGTSSRSTKLIHGGVRYLEKAVWSLDKKSLHLVFDALHERINFINTAPYMSHPLPIMTPCYTWWEPAYYWMGLKMYDLLSHIGGKGLPLSRYLTPAQSQQEFPMLHRDGLKGSIVYYDGQMNDARMNVSLALTAAQHGAVVANHVETVALHKDSDGKINGATIRDVLTDHECYVSAKIVVNATGPFSDSIRKLDDPKCEEIITASSGVHITLPDYYSAPTTGLIIPKTKDGRVLFLLPWLGSTIAGTTDSSSKITRNPQPHEDEIKFILEGLSDYLNIKVRREDVRSAWSGIRPLAKDTDAESTSTASRDHMLLVSKNGLVSIVGGKWTTFRKMAQDTVDKAIEVGGLQPKTQCRTVGLRVIGAEGWDSGFFATIAQNYSRKKKVKHTEEDIVVPIASDIAHNLSMTYGTRAVRVAEIAAQYGNRIHDDHPFLEAEVIYAAEEEMACTAVDFLARRIRLAFLDVKASHDAVPKIVNLLAMKLNWDEERKMREVDECRRFLETMDARTGSRGNVKEPDAVDVKEPSGETTVSYLPGARSNSKE